MKFPTLARRVLAPCALMLAAGSSNVYALDTGADDYIPAGPDSNIVGLYYFFSDFNTYKPTNGPALTDSTRLQTQVGVFRFVHYFTIGQMLANVQFVQPFGGFTEGRMDGVNLEKGGMQLGDTTLLATIWPYVNREKGQYLNIAAYLSLPTGSYNAARNLNLGDNRFSGTLQIGYHYAFSERWSGEAVLDTTFYSDNTKATAEGGTLSQNPTTEAQGWVMYNPTPSSTLGLGYAATFGGRSSIDGAITGAASGSQEIRASYSFFVGKHTMVLTEVDRGLSATGGFKKDLGLLLRVTTLF